MAPPLTQSRENQFESKNWEDMEIKSIDALLLTRGPLAIRVVEVESPGRFWIQVENGREALKKLQEDLEYKMGKKRSMIWPHHVRTGTIVAVKRNGRWERGVVGAIRGQQVTVELKDWGRMMTTSAGNLYHLPRMFYDFPWCAFPCSLGNTYPNGNHATWAAAACHFMQTTTMGSKGWIRIQGAEEDGTAMVQMTIETAKGQKDVNRLIVEQLYATSDQNSD